MPNYTKPSIVVFRPRKVCIFISFITLFPFPDPGTGRRWQEAGTLTPGQT